MAKSCQLPCSIYCRSLVGACLQMIEIMQCRLSICVTRKWAEQMFISPSCCQASKPLAQPAHFPHVCRTQERPEPLAVARAAALASNCLAAAAQLLEGSQGRPTEDSPDGGEGHAAWETAVVAWEAAVVGALFSPALSDLPFLIQLRHEALPNASQALPPALVQPPAPRGQPDSLSRVMGARSGPPAKRARAFLDAFPAKVGWIWAGTLHINVQNTPCDHLQAGKGGKGTACRQDEWSIINDLIRLLAHPAIIL